MLKASADHRACILSILENADSSQGIPASDRIETVHACKLMLMRCVLAFSALAIIRIDPSELGRHVALTYTSLALYCGYSAALAIFSYRADWPAPARVLHWVDILFFCYLVALTEGTGSIFFHFFIFAIMVASFSRGFAEGLAVTAASLLLFLAVGLYFGLVRNEFELNQTMVRALYLVSFGYMIAYWGGYELLLKRRLAFLQEISSVWSPRFGAEQAIRTDLERLLAFYGGNSCVLVMRYSFELPSARMYSVVRGAGGASAAPNAIADSTAELLLQLPKTIAVFYHDPSGSLRQKLSGYAAFDVHTKARIKGFHEESVALASLLDARAFISIPYSQHNGVTGRIFIAGERSVFSRADIEFLISVSTSMATVVDNMALMEEIVTRASEQERLKISRDLHDTTIQPYIGLKLALDALQRQAGANNPLSPCLAELTDMTEMTIRDLHDYTQSLKEHASMPGESLIAAAKKQAERLGRFYGINVEVRSDITPRLKGHVAAEAFQIISEGLSNILRHTAAKKAFISIICSGERLLLQLGNEAHDRPLDAGGFTPRSIHERAQALGGSVFVEENLDGYTVVHVTIPMEMKSPHEY